MAIAVPGTLSNYTQDYGYGTHHKDRDIDPKTGIFWAYNQNPKKLRFWNFNKDSDYENESRFWVRVQNPIQNPNSRLGF